MPEPCPGCGRRSLEVTRRVRTTHAGKGRAAAGLDGKMQERGDAVAVGRHAVDQLLLVTSIGSMDER